MSENFAFLIKFRSVPDVTQSSSAMGLFVFSPSVLYHRIKRR